MFPVSIKGVLQSPEGLVVLMLNERDEWELPGGRIELGETAPQCLAREIDEELAVEVSVGGAAGFVLVRGHSRQARLYLHVPLPVAGRFRADDQP
ncbi:NUDIX domain-containing protein [Pseudomonas sp. H2_E02]